MAVTPPVVASPVSAVSDNLKGCLGFVVSMIIVGSIAEALMNISPKAAYLFVAIVVLGYATSGGNVTALSDFFDSVTKNHSLPNGGRVR